MANISAAIVKFEELRSLAFGDITGDYEPVGMPFANPIRLLKITNNTNANLLVSFDGITDHDIVVGNSFCLYDFGSNKANQCGFFEQSKGDRVYVKAETSNPISGDIYVTVIYAADA